MKMKRLAVLVCAMCLLWTTGCGGAPAAKVEEPTPVPSSYIDISDPDQACERIAAMIGEMSLDQVSPHDVYLDGSTLVVLVEYIIPDECTYDGSFLSEYNLGMGIMLEAESVGTAILKHPELDELWMWMRIEVVDIAYTTMHRSGITDARRFVASEWQLWTPEERLKANAFAQKYNAMSVLYFAPTIVDVRSKAGIDTCTLQDGSGDVVGRITKNGWDITLEIDNTADGQQRQQHLVTAILAIVSSVKGMQPSGELADLIQNAQRREYEKYGFLHVIKEQFDSMVYRMRPK